MELKLLGPAGDGTRRYMLANGETLIGRRPDCRIVLDAPSICPRHARLFTVDGHAVIHRLDEAWPVYVNGEPVKRRVLADGDDIELGHYRMRYIAAGNAAGREASAEPARSPMSMQPGADADPVDVPREETVPLDTDRVDAAAEIEEPVDPQSLAAATGNGEPAAPARSDAAEEATDAPEPEPGAAAPVTANATPPGHEDGAPAAAEIIDPAPPEPAQGQVDADQDDMTPAGVEWGRVDAGRDHMTPAGVEGFDGARVDAEPSPPSGPDTEPVEALQEDSRPLGTDHTDSLGAFPTSFEAPAPATVDAALPKDSDDPRPAAGDTESPQTGAFHLDILTGINQGRRVTLTNEMVVLGFNRQRLVELRSDDGVLWLRRLDDEAAAELNGVLITEDPSEAKPDDVISLQRIDLRIHWD